MRIKANKMALSVLAAFRSCFFSVLFLAFFLPWLTAVVTAKAVEAKDGVFFSAWPLINCLGTSLASRGNELISSALLRLSAAKKSVLLVLFSAFFESSGRKWYRKIGHLIPNARVHFPDIFPIKKCAVRK